MIIVNLIRAKLTEVEEETENFRHATQLSIPVSFLSIS
jgi:hypothetical protein